MRRALVTFAVLVLALGPGSALAAEGKLPAGTFGPEQLDELSATVERANSLRNQGDLAGARDSREQVLEAFTRTLGPEHPDTLFTKDSLAMTVAALDEASPEEEPIHEDDLISVEAWTEHQRMWLQKLFELGAQARGAKALPQLRRALGKIQRHFKGETTWLRKNADRFAPDSCLEADRTEWAKRVKQAQRHLNKAVTATKRGNVDAVTSSLRRFDQVVFRFGGCPAAVAQSPEPSEAETRVEVPEGGYAVTFPEFWQHFRTTATDANGMVEMYGISEATARWLEEQGELGVFLVGRLDFGSQLCQIQSQPSNGMTVADQADAQAGSLSQSPSVTSVVSLAMHDWPVGEVAQITFNRLRADEEEEFVGFWLFSDGATLHSITCYGQIMLGDEYWQSIAESFEFLPAEEMPVSSGGGERVEMPEDGYALTFPEGWAISTEEEFYAILAVADDGANCSVQVETSFGDEPEVLAGESEEFLIDIWGDSITDGPHSEILSLPAGVVIRLDFDIEREEQVFRDTQYLYDDGEMVVTLTCVASARPDDGWLSIAETFELLPAE